MVSIIQSNKECYVCGTTTNLHSHHIFFGTANRKLSEKYGLKVWLCKEHHQGRYGVHGADGHELDIELKRLAELQFLEHYGKDVEEFIKIFGRNYL